MSIKENSHKNHRNRLKTKVKNHGLECLAYHEILEFLLTYTIPRKDTNPTAHKLIEYFGSFSNVLDADYYDLQKVEGVGPESALFISSLASLMEIYNKSKIEMSKSVLDTTEKSVKFFRTYFRVKSKEFMIMACLSKAKRVIKTFVYNGKDDTEINFDLRQIGNTINDVEVKSIVLYHTHPFGEVNPSLEDLKTTQNIINICLMQGIDFEDHLIFNETEHYSFKTQHLIDTMKQNYFSTFKFDKLYIKSLKDKS